MKFLQFLLCFALSFPLFAQHSIKGIVLDNTNKDELIGVKVQLFSNQVLLAYMITDIEGIFGFENIKKGQYVLELQCPGFRNKSVEDNKHTSIQQENNLRGFVTEKEIRIDELAIVGGIGSLVPELPIDPKKGIWSSIKRFFRFEWLRKE